MMHEMENPEKCRNLTGAPVGEGEQTMEELNIYNTL